MKEEQRKEDQPQEGQSKEDHTREVSLNVSEDPRWAWCGLCNDVWDTKRVLYGFARCLPPDDGRWDDPLAEKLPNKLCPDHAEEIVVEGRRMGMKKALSGKQLDEIRNQYERYGPVCKGRDLEWKVNLHPNLVGINELVLACCKCHALILLGVLYTRDANDDECWAELMYVLYREDLQTKEQKELDEAWNTIHRITNRRGSKSKISCE
jgi:hypothetical protein